MSTTKTTKTTKKKAASSTKSTSSRPRIIRMDAGVIEQQNKIERARKRAEGWECEQCQGTDATVVIQEIVEFHVDPTKGTISCGGRESDCTYAYCPSCGWDDRW